jgi:hypothetical protein
MRRMTAIGWWMVVLGLLAEAPKAQDLPYLNDRKSSPSYVAAYKSMFRGVSRLPVWIRDYNRTSNGVETPGKTVTFSGQPYEIYGVCQPHNCGFAYMKILFSPGGEHAWAIYMEDQKPKQFFGNPDAEIRNFLLNTAQEF